METIQDFEDLLELFEQHSVRYLIIGGLAFIYHAKPRYNKDMGLWIDPDSTNVDQANQALAEFGSPYLMDPSDRAEILQLGVEPNRIDLLRDPASEGGPSFTGPGKRESATPTAASRPTGSTAGACWRSSATSTIPAIRRTREFCNSWKNRNTR